MVALCTSIWDAYPEVGAALLRTDSAMKRVAEMSGLRKYFQRDDWAHLERAAAAEAGVQSLSVFGQLVQCRCDYVSTLAYWMDFPQCNKCRTWFRPQEIFYGTRAAAQIAVQSGARISGIRLVKAYALFLEQQGGTTWPHRVMTVA